jgi:adenine-specific DNA-methyltransferase
MARRAKSKAGGKADVETYKHKEAKRKNIPTAENQKLIADDDKAVRKLRWPRNPDLDPQLVWRGKDFEPDPLEVDAPPIYIQEKIKPQAIIEDLRRQTKERSKDVASQFDFFHDFNGLPEGWKEDATQSYYHDEGNWSNRMILGDSLLVMTSLLHKDREALRGKVQCIYFDPPYGIKFNSNWQPSTKSREVKDTGVGNVSREPEVIRAFRDTWKDGVHTYLSYLRDRLVAAHDLLTNTGSIFIQIGIENCHLVGTLLDEVFGQSNRITQINFITANPQTGRYIEDNTDYLLWYAKDKNVTKFYASYLPKSELKGGAAAYRFIRTPDLYERTITPEERANPSLLPENAKIYRGDKLTSGHPPGSYDVVFRGRTWAPGKGFWSTSETGMERLKRADRLVGLGNTLSYIRFLDDFSAIPIGSQWTDTITAGDLLPNLPSFIRRVCSSFAPRWGVLQTRLV